MLERTEAEEFSLDRNRDSRLRFVAVCGIVLVFGSVSGAQGRYELGTITRSEHIWIEGGASGATPVAGVTAKVRFTERFGLSADLTKAGGRVDRSYEGRFVSFVQDRNPTQEEFDRFAPIARRSLGYIPGVGGSLAFTARNSVSTRLGLVLLAGFAVRRYRQTTTHEILHIPEAVDPDLATRSDIFAATSRFKYRGGLLLGLDVPIRLTPHFSLGPEIRFVYGGPARIGDKHRELGIGGRIMWTF